MQNFSAPNSTKKTTALKTIPSARVLMPVAATKEVDKSSSHKRQPQTHASIVLRSAVGQFYVSKTESRREGPTLHLRTKFLRILVSTCLRFIIEIKLHRFVQLRLVERYGHGACTLHRNSDFEKQKNTRIANTMNFSYFCETCFFPDI